MTWCNKIHYTTPRKIKDRCEGKSMNETGVGEGIGTEHS
jgi:hypothetical protein